MYGLYFPPFASNVNMRTYRTMVSFVDFDIPELPNRTMRLLAMDASARLGMQQ